MSCFYEKPTCSGICCLECNDFKDCEFPCYEAFTKGYTKENYKKCQHYQNEKFWSWNEVDDDAWTHGTFDSREEAIENALSNIEEIKSYLETETPSVYIGECVYAPLPTTIDSERILWDLDEQYADESGCENYIYEGVTDEQTKWLEDKLSDVMIEFHKMIGLKPCWFTVVEQEEINLCEYKKENK